MEIKENPQETHLETNPEFYTGVIAEKTGDHKLDILKGAKLLSIFDALEQKK